MKAVIQRYEVTYYSGTGHWLGGGFRWLRRLPRQIYEPDAAAVTEHRSAAAAIAAHLRPLETFTADVPAPGQHFHVIPAGKSLFARRRLPARSEIHTRVYIEDCSETERAAIFKAVTE